jgi:hypothetical protein
VACGSDADPELSKTPAEQCQDFVGAYCDKEAACAVATDHWRTIKDCEFSWQVSFPCDGVVNVHGSVSTCIAAIDSISCDAVERAHGITLPTSCKVFVVR